MGSITTEVASTSDALVSEMFTFANYVVQNYMQEFLLLMLLSVVAGIAWRAARRFLGRA